MENIIKLLRAFALTHLTPSSIKSAALDKSFTMGFKLESNGCWYADIEQWPGAHSQLMMVAGADDFLDAVNAAFNLDGYVTLEVSISPFDGADKLVKTEETSAGATYHIPSGAFGRSQLWLCNVSRWVFGAHPEIIWYKVINHSESD